MGYTGPPGGLAGWFQAAQPITERALREVASESARHWKKVTTENTPIETFLKQVGTKPPYHLRNSWEIKELRIIHLPEHGNEDVYETGIETSVEYACTFDPSTQVVCLGGNKRIGDVREGDVVLTQTGDWKSVNRAWSFPAVNKPDLVEVTVPWRADRLHKLTVTQDHKMLVRRGQRSLWVPAGDLRGGDLLHVRTKKAHNAGAGKVKVCEECDGRYRTQGRRYCSIACRDKAWAAGASPHVGAKRTAETRALLSLRGRERGAGRQMNRMLAQRGYATSHERAVGEWLEARGIEYDREVAIGDHVVDFYLPDRGQIIEADGAYWHQDQAKDVARDGEILRNAPGVEILHLHFYEERFTPSLDPEPLPGVTYQVCNPSPRSFVDGDTYAAVPILTRRDWRYGDKKPAKHASFNARLYDISVEGVHSFVASGICISNSYVEEGTGLWGPEHRKYVIRPKKPGGWLSWIARDGYTRRDGSTVKAGQRVFAKEVLHPGSPGQHMVAIGAHMTEAEFERIAAEPLRRWADEIERVAP